MAESKTKVSYLFETFISSISRTQACIGGLLRGCWRCEAERCAVLKANKYSYWLAGVLAFAFPYGEAAWKQHRKGSLFQDILEVKHRCLTQDFWWYIKITWEQNSKKKPCIFKCLENFSDSCASSNCFQEMHTKINIQNQCPHRMIKSYILRIRVFHKKMNEDLHCAHLLWQWI